MKIFYFLFLLVFTTYTAMGQDSRYIDSLKMALSQAKEGTNKVNIYLEIGWSYLYSSQDTALSYIVSGLELAKKLGFKNGEFGGLVHMGEALSMKGNYPKALEIKLKALKEAEKSNNPKMIAFSQFYIAHEYLREGDYRKALNIYLNLKVKNQSFLSHSKHIFACIGDCYIRLNKVDSAYHYVKQAFEIDQKEKKHWEMPYHFMGVIYEKKGNYTKALDFYRTANQYRMASLASLGIASIFKKIGREDSAIYYAKKVVEKKVAISHPNDIFEASSLLTGIFKSRSDTSNAFKYQQLMLAAKDSLFSQEKVKYIENLTFNEQQRQQEMKAQQEAYRTKIKIYALVSIGILLFAVALILWRNFRQKQKAFTLLEKQKEETEQALEELKVTQEQLIKQEKAALENKLQVEMLKKEQELAVYQSRAVELEMQALRAQMNPHFIFNCLNSINRFMLKNEAESASDYLTKFSKLIRLILQNSQSQTVLLENELEALELYLEMEMLRFEDQFDYQITCHPLLEVEDLEVPPLIIQPYVENAIWHGLIHKEGKGHISIYLQRRDQTLVCSIEDDGIGRKRAAELNSKSATKKKSLGMQITSHRLELLKELIIWQAAYRDG